MAIHRALGAILVLSHLLVTVFCDICLELRGPGAMIMSRDSQVAIGNGFTCAIIDLARPRVSELRGSFDGSGNFGVNVLADVGIALEREDLNGMVHRSSDAGPASFVITSNASERVELTVLGLLDNASAPAVNDTWTISLAARARSVNFKTAGRLSRAIAARAVRLAMAFRPASIYSLFDRGVVQMRGARSSGEGFYGSNDTLRRLYAVGGLSGEAENASISLRQVSPGSSRIGHVIMSKSALTSAGLSGVQMLLAGDLPPVLDMWSEGYRDPLGLLKGVQLSEGISWSISVDLAPNNLDFPVQGPFGDLTTDANIPQSTLQALLTGIYASPVGQLCTHDNAVEKGFRVGQMATTIARPDYGYQGNYNFFDPDNYLSTAALLYSGDPYLQEQVRFVLETNGNAMDERTGQLPHHFDGLMAIYEALSGETQTGPNFFWILSCFNYAKVSGNLEWLQGYMPKLRQASAFLLGMIDPSFHLLKSPGSLMIDVFIRSNFSTDTNAMAVGFFHEFADAEAAVGNTTGAATLHQIADGIGRAAEVLLWSNSSNDHYVTQLNPDGTTRDLMDYDSNLVALAHGLASKDRAATMLKRIDAGPCTHGGRGTFVSEQWYGRRDTTFGETGDSWNSMGRIGWFDALARKRFGDQKAFDSLLLDPLIDDVNRFTWLHERYSCEGEQQWNRTADYFEYPSVTAMMIHYIRYGIQLGFQEVTIAPFGLKNFEYHIGNIDVEYSPEKVALTVPGTGVKSIVIHGLVSNRIYNFRACDVTGSVTVLQDGIAYFSAPVGYEGRSCTITLTSAVAENRPAESTMRAQGALSLMHSLSPYLTDDSKYRAL